MKGNEKIIEKINDLLADELTAIYSGPQNLDSVISYTWDIKRGGPSGTNAQEVSAFI